MIRTEPRHALRPFLHARSRLTHGAESSDTTQQGLSLVEVLVAMAVLVLGAIPLFDLLHGSRGMLGQSRDFLTLETRCLSALAWGRARIHAGVFEAVPASGKRSSDLSDADVHCVLGVRRLEDPALFLLTAQAQTTDRRMTVTRVVCDPLASCISVAEPLPDTPR